MDRRLTPATAKIAHTSLRGVISGLPFTHGEMWRVTVPLADLLAAPHGFRDRQLAYGAGFCVIDHDQDHAFGFATEDGYCGWLPVTSLGKMPDPTHWVASTGTHLYSGPRVQAREIMALPMAAVVAVIGFENGFAKTKDGYVPTPHLRVIGDYCADPADVAIQFLGAPYLWGGNSRAGVDCSGLVQLCLNACGISAARDSDLQQVLGDALGDDAPLMRGDLLFWKGHVAMAVDAATLIHANGHTMSVGLEDITACIARIAAQGGGPVIQRRRISIHRPDELVL